MSVKDFLTLLLCQYGYDRNISIEMRYGEFGSTGYTIYAENADGDVYEYDACEDSMFAIYCLLSYMKENHVELSSDWWNHSLKTVLNKKERERIIIEEDERKRETDEFSEKMQPFYDYQERMNPCVNCEENPRDLEWYPHWQCSLHYRNCCKKYLEFREEMRKLQVQHMKENHIGGY